MQIFKALTRRIRERIGRFVFRLWLENGGKEALDNVDVRLWLENEGKKAFNNVDCDGLVAIHPTKSDEVVVYIGDQSSTYIIVWRGGLSWKSPNGAWHAGADACDLLLKRLEDSRYKGKIKIRATITGRLSLYKCGTTISNCTIVISDS